MLRCSLQSTYGYSQLKASLNESNRSDYVEYEKRNPDLWCFHLQTREKVKGYKQHFVGAPLPTVHGGDDICYWGRGQNQFFSTATAWKTSRPRMPKVPWYSVIWFKSHIPRRSFILWLIVHGRLNTMNRLMGIGVLDHFVCIFCKKEVESHDHVFFACELLSKLLHVWMTKCSIRLTASSWHENVLYFSKKRLELV
ncbi:hypothetical protein Drorol1_Dr00021467 [Drosera rotundifolia]